MKKRHFMMMLCALLVGGTMFSCASESGTDTPPEIEVNEGDVFAMTVRPASLILDAGESETITVTYKKNNKGVGGGHISAKSNNINCFVINSETKSDYTGANGEFDVIVEAKNVTEACDGTVEITDLDGRVESRFVNISVSSGTGGNGGGTPTGNPELTVLEPSNGQITLNQKGEKANIVVEYRNAKGKTQADTMIEIQNSKDSCIKPAFGDITTGSNGQATLPITAVGENCTSLITLTVGDVSEEVAVTVGEADEYFRTLKINYLNTGDNDPSNIGMRHNDVKQLIYGFGPDETCPSFEELLAEDGIPTLSRSQTVKSFRQTNPFFTQKLELSRNKSPYSIIAYAKNSADELLAVGCVGGVGPDTESTCNECKGGKCNDVCLPIYEIPILFGDEYEVTTNFDLFSRFVRSCNPEKDDGCYKAEKMTAGDWVQFIIAFCRDPFGELVSFIWDNSIARLADIEAINNITFLKDLITNEGKKLALAALRGALKPTLEAQDWYRYITQVAPDIADLASNMQLQGNFKMGTYNDLTMSNMKVTFESLQYQWSLETWGRDLCMPNAYGKPNVDLNSDPKVCRHNMPLKINNNNNNTIEGSCDASIALSSDPGIDGYMTFSVSNLTFKWATILYSTIFGKILPLALKYNDTTKVTRGFYVSAFLEAVLFKLLIDRYNDPSPKGENAKVYLGKSETVDGTTYTYPPLTGEYCEQFVQAAAYIVSVKTTGSTVSEVVKTLANMVCGDKVLGQLDTLIVNKFNEIEADTSQGLTMKTTDCPLYSEDNVYKQLGKPDAGATVPTANEVFSATKPEEKTSRCIWNVSVGSFAFDGIFHAEDNSLY